MIETLRKLSELVGKENRQRAYPVFILVLLMAITEALGVASIMPFIAILTKPTVIETNSYLSAVYQFLNFQSTEAFLIFFGAATLGLLIGSVSLRALTLWVQVRFVHFQAHIVATRMVASYLRQPYTWFLNQSSSDIGANILTEVNSAFQGVAYPVMLLFANFIVGLLLIGLLIAVDPMLAIASTVALGGVYVGIFLMARKYLARMGTIRVQANRNRHRALYEAFGGIKDIKVAGAEASFLGRFSDNSERTARAAVAVQIVGEMPSFAMQAVVFGGILAAILYLISSRGSMQDALPVISLYAVAGYRLLPTVQNAYRNLMTIRYNLPALDALYRDVRQFSDGSGPELASFRSASANDSIALSRSIELDSVSFQYSTSERPTLRNLNLLIPAFTTAALVGPTGSGKSTAVDLILALFKPTSGTLRVDNIVVTEDNARSWQSIIGYVPQSIFLSDDTIAANIAFGVPQDAIDMATIEKVSRIANLHDFVSAELPNGYDTLIGERGVRLSGGQRQRIGIARALYHDPDVVILDEATSALDNLTEQAVIESIYSIGRRKTVIMIAHRLTTIRNCDRIFVLEGGRVADAGTYDELLERSSLFRDMATRNVEESSKLIE